MRTGLSWETCRLQVNMEEIALVAALLEAYDNHFLMRTEDRESGVLVVWYPQNNRHLLAEVLLDLQRNFSVNVLTFATGMEGLDQVFPE